MKKIKSNEGKQYLVSGKELRGMCAKSFFERFIKSKKPVKTLDREDVEKIFNKCIDSEMLLTNQKDLNSAYREREEWRRNFINQLLSLVPEEGEVIAEGSFCETNIAIPKKYLFKKVQISIKQIGDGE